MKIEFDLEEFRIWLTELDEVEYPEYGQWDNIRRYYVVNREGNLMYVCVFTPFPKSHINTEIDSDLILHGKIKED